MAKPINTNHVVLIGDEAKRVLKKAEDVRISEAYKEKMDRCVQFYREVEEKSSK